MFAYGRVIVMNIMAGKNDLTANTLKNIAIALMVLDHFCAVFLEHESLIGSLSRVPGRVVAPIMCYLIAEGYFYTSNIRKYIWRLFLFAIISHFFYVGYFQLPWWKATGVFWGLTLGLIALHAVKSDKLSIYLKPLAILLCCALAVPANWNYITVLWIVGFGMFRGNFLRQMIVFILIGLCIHAIPSILRFGTHHSYQFAFLLTIPLLILYRGRRGYNAPWIKWGFYVFYPLHLFGLYLLRMATAL